MKKTIILVLAILFIAGGIAQAVTPSLPYTGEIRGQGKAPSDPHRTFRFVRYYPAGPSPMYMADHNLTAGCAVIWLSNDGVTISTTTTSWDSRVAGVVATTILTPDSYNSTMRAAYLDEGKKNWGWLQTYGPGLAINDLAVTAGHAFGTASYPGKATYMYPSSTAKLPAQQGIGGFFINTCPAQVSYPASTKATKSSDNGTYYTCPAFIRTE